MNLNEILYVLSDQWTPPKLLYRDKELNELVNSIKYLYPKNFWISGDRGLGKTLTLKIYMSICNSLDVKVKPFYVECVKRPMQTISKLAYQLHTKPNTLSIIERLTELEHDRVILIFDDLDAMKFIRREFSPFLHALYNGIDISKFQFIFSTTMKYNEVNRIFSPSVLSRLQLEPLFFKPYNKHEIRGLLRQRLEYTDLEVDDEAIKFISEKMARIGGDFRKALEILRQAVSEAKGEKITLEIVNKVWRKVKLRWWRDRITSMPPHQALLLGCIVEVTVSRLAREGNITKDEYYETIIDNYPLVSLEDVLKRYKHHIKNLEAEPLRKSMIYYYIEKLEIEGYIYKAYLSKNDPENYRGKRGVYIQLIEKIENLEPILRDIKWNEII